MAKETHEGALRVLGAVLGRHLRWVVMWWEEGVSGDVVGVLVKEMGGAKGSVRRALCEAVGGALYPEHVDSGIDHNPNVAPNPEIQK
jgi:hypothetical protein